MDRKDLYLEEWKANKDLMDKFGDRIYDLRKYGFSFITALLTAQTILTNNLVTNQASVTPNVKLAVIGITILLIFTLAIFEKSYQILMDAANQRALIIETNLNLELLETVSYQATYKHVNLINTSIYVSFIIAAFILGYFVAGFNYYLLGLSLSLIILLLLISLLFSPRSYDADWTIDKMECYKGGKVGITCTYLGEKWDIKCTKKDGEDEKFFEKLRRLTSYLYKKRHIWCPEEDVKTFNESAWKIQTEDGFTIYEEPVDKRKKDPITISVNQSYTWFWNTDDGEGVREGEIYQVLPQGWINPLRRRIRILKRDENK